MKRLLGATIVLAVVAMLASPTPAAIDLQANFDYGNTTGSPDGYTGTVGNGWSKAWESHTWEILDQPVAVTSGDPGYDELVDGSSGNYLSVLARSANTSGRRATVWRDCTGELGIDLSQPFSIDFLYRIDEDAAGLTANFTEANDRYQIHDSTVSNTGAETSFWIGAHGNTGDTPWVADEDVGYWCFFDGQKDGSIGRDYRATGGADETYWVNSGFQITSGTTYTFHIDVDPINYEWGATISSDRVGDPASFSASGLGWRKDVSTNPTLAGLTRFVGATSDDVDTRAFSLDSVRYQQNRTPSIGGMSTVVARFDDGLTDTAVDGYVGMAGNGWDNAWQAATSGTAVMDPRVPSVLDPDYAELKPGTGNYVKMTVTNEIPLGETGSASAGIARDYTRVDEDGIDWTKEHTIEFTVRIDEDIDPGGFFDEFSTSADFYQILDCASQRLGSNPTVTWAARVYGGTADTVTSDMVGDWLFYDGNNDSGAVELARQVDSDIAVVTGGVYDFAITIDPVTKTYDVELSDGTNTFTASDLGWRTSADSVGGWLNFVARGDTIDDVREWSIDNIVISQQLPAIPGDTNNDGKVDSTDAGVLADNWGMTEQTGGSSIGDFNGDGNVDMLDASILAANWGDHNEAGAEGVVPEPGSLILLGFGVLMLAARRRRGR